MSKKQLREGLLDNVFKGVLGAYFGSKMIDKHARKMTMGDPEVKKAVKSFKDELANFDAIMAKYD